MQIENDYDKEVYNGDIGYIDDVDPDDGELTASFDGRAISYRFGELDTLVLAYAATIHKSQGSEYPAVVIPVMTQHYAMLQRNLLYTGVTQVKKLVVLVGQKKAVAIAVPRVTLSPLVCVRTQYGHETRRLTKDFLFRCKLWRTR
jgi:exodeoxyribonuclease V alpha subunit